MENKKNLYRKDIDECISDEDRLQRLEQHIIPSFWEYLCLCFMYISSFEYNDSRPVLPGRLALLKRMISPALFDELTVNLKSTHLDFDPEPVTWFDVDMMIKRKSRIKALRKKLKKNKTDQAILSAQQRIADQ